MYIMYHMLLSLRSPNYTSMYKTVAKFSRCILTYELFIFMFDISVKYIQPLSRLNHTESGRAQHLQRSRMIMTFSMCYIDVR